MFPFAVQTSYTELLFLFYLFLHFAYYWCTPFVGSVFCILSYILHNTEALPLWALSSVSCLVASLRDTRCAALSWLSRFERRSPGLVWFFSHFLFYFHSLLRFERPVFCLLVATACFDTHWTLLHCFPLGCVAGLFACPCLDYIFPNICLLILLFRP